MIVVINAGSSSVKFSLYGVTEGKLSLESRGQVEEIYTSPAFIAKDAAGNILDEQRWDKCYSLGHQGAIDCLQAFLRTQARGRTLLGVGHRVVHGGPDFTSPVRVNDAVLNALDAFISLAPLHQPHNLAPIRMLQKARPELAQVACFDTAFHRTNPDLAQRFALPAHFHDAGIRRYGFHGLSYEYIASCLPDVDPQAARGKVVVLHLGNGSSMCAIENGRSMASTMGFTAVDGLPMGTRSGALDPGVVLFLMDQYQMDTRAVENLLYKESGLLGVSGISSDMRTLMSSAEPGAKLAVDLYLYRIRREFGSLVAAMGGLDALVFTAGIGENATLLRERICQDAAWLGLQLDTQANLQGRRCISAPESPVKAYIIATNEELMIAQHTLDVLAAQA